MASPFAITEDDPDNPGWIRWRVDAPGRFNDFLGDIIVKRDDDAALVRMKPAFEHGNLAGFMHGGATLGFIDVSLFAALSVMTDHEPIYAVTVDLQTQFTGPINIGHYIEAKLFITKETGSLIFIRGTISQNTNSVAAFTALIKKAPQSSKKLL